MHMTNINSLAYENLTADTGAEVRLGDLWAQRPVALVFLRAAEK